MENKDKNTLIQEIIASVFNLPIPKLQEARKEQMSRLIDTVINGDVITKYLVTPVTINSEREIYLYILTNNRLIVVVISTNSNNISTYPFVISEIQKVAFNSPDINKTSVEISLVNNRLLGLEYSPDRLAITSFFQELSEIVKNKAM